MSFIIVSLFPNLEHLDFSDKSSWQCTDWSHIYDALQLALCSQSLYFYVWNVKIINFCCCTRHINSFRIAFIVIGYSLAWPGKLNLNLNIISPISATITSQKIITNSKEKKLHVLFVGLFVCRDTISLCSLNQLWIHGAQASAFSVFDLHLWTLWKSNNILKHNQIFKKNHKLSYAFERTIAHVYGCMKCEIVSSLLLKVLDYMCLVFINIYGLCRRMMFWSCLSPLVIS